MNPKTNTVHLTKSVFILRRSPLFWHTFSEHYPAMFPCWGLYICGDSNCDYSPPHLRELFCVYQQLLNDVSCGCDGSTWTHIGGCSQSWPAVGPCCRLTGRRRRDAGSPGPQQQGPGSWWTKGERSTESTDMLESYSAHWYTSCIGRFDRKPPAIKGGPTYLKTPLRTRPFTLAGEYPAGPVELHRTNTHCLSFLNVLFCVS